MCSSDLEENHEKLSSSNDELLASYACLKLAHESITIKVTSCETQVDNSTTLTKNAILSCASPSSSSTRNIGTSCNELFSLPCCSNNDASTSSSTCVVTNHVEKRGEIKAQAAARQYACGRRCRE